MGFSRDFDGMIKVRFPNDAEVIEILKAGDRRKMAVLLLKRMALSPETILSHLDAGAQDELRERCEEARPIAVLLERLLEYEMTHGFALIERRPEVSVDDPDQALLAT